MNIDLLKSISTFYIYFFIQIILNSILYKRDRDIILKLAVLKNALVFFSRAGKWPNLAATVGSQSEVVFFGGEAGVMV